MALLVRLVFTSHMVPSVLPTSSEPLQQQMLTDTEKNNDINISLRPPLRFLAPPRQNALQIYNNILQSYVCIKLLCGGFDRHSYIYVCIYTPFVGDVLVFEGVIRSSVPSGRIKGIWYGYLDLSIGVNKAFFFRSGSGQYPKWVDLLRYGLHSVDSFRWSKQDTVAKNVPRKYSCTMWVKQ
jgi:hypothetical protein